MSAISLPCLSFRQKACFSRQRGQCRPRERPNQGPRFFVVLKTEKGEETDGTLKGEGYYTFDIALYRHGGPGGLKRHAFQILQLMLHLGEIRVRLW